MSDDNDTREEILADWCREEYSTAGRRTLLAELDRADPLRTLLADEDGRTADLIARAIHADWAGDYAHFESSVYHKRYASAGLAVLAALRVVAG